MGKDVHFAYRLGDLVYLFLFFVFAFLFSRIHSWFPPRLHSFPSGRLLSFLFFFLSFFYCYLLLLLDRIAVLVWAPSREDQQQRDMLLYSRVLFLYWCTRHGKTIGRGLRRGKRKAIRCSGRVERALGLDSGLIEDTPYYALPPRSL